MEKAGFGRIVMISSGTILAGRPNFTHYTTSKMAVVSMARTMGRELGGTGVTVNAVLPGLTYTGIAAAGIDDAVYDYIVERQSIPRREVPEDLVPAVMFLASEGSGFITGQALLVDGGMAHTGV
jgi:3-oxoacyl-[acyl-carrier protein] reductase